MTHRPVTGMMSVPARWIPYLRSYKDISFGSITHGQVDPLDSCQLLYRPLSGGENSYKPLWETTFEEFSRSQDDGIEESR